MKGDYGMKNFHFMSGVSWGGNDEATGERKQRIYCSIVNIMY